MNKQAIIDLLHKNYSSFITYIHDLSPGEYSFHNEEKWTAGQQLEHIVLCVKPLVQVFSMDKLTIEQNFGRSGKPGRTYEVLLENYLEKLKEGGKAPVRYVPEAITPNQRALLSETLTKLIQDLSSKIETFTEEELDSLLIPHPLLGNLTLREMLYNAAYHVQHHHEQAIHNLKEMAS
jgi:hypothetical protein